MSIFVNYINGFDIIKYEGGQMSKKAKTWNEAYEQLGFTCNLNSCKPCTYPNCQRFAREKKAVKKIFAPAFKSTDSTV